MRAKSSKILNTLDQKSCNSLTRFVIVVLSFILWPSVGLEDSKAANRNTSNLAQYGEKFDVYSTGQFCVEPV